jgi:hypothetical protein
MTTSDVAPLALALQAFGRRSARPLLLVTSRSRSAKKSLRPNLRVIRENRFRELATIDQVADELFGIG